MDSYDNYIKGVGTEPNTGLQLKKNITLYHSVIVIGTITRISMHNSRNEAPPTESILI